MKISNISLPYPVLGNQDDILPILPDDCINMPDPILENDEYVFTIDLKYDNAEIKKLVADGKAEYTCEVTCPATYMRACFHPIDPIKPQIIVRLHRKSVYKRIEFNCYITVKQSIPSYRNRGFNKDYGNASFDLEPGDVLAVFPLASYITDLRYDQLYAAGSFMVVLEAAKDCDRTWFNLNDERIVVYLPHDLYEQFKLLRGDRDFNEMFHASIVFNALTYALSHYNEETHGAWKWAEAIKYRIEHEDGLSKFDITKTEQAYELAQELLKDPYKRLFDQIKKSKS